MDGAADGVAGKVGVVHRLGHDALPGESSVAVDEQREIFFRPPFAGAILLGARAADCYRIDGFEVAGIRHQVNMNFLSSPVMYSPVAPM